MTRQNTNLWIRRISILTLWIAIMGLALPLNSIALTSFNQVIAADAKVLEKVPKAHSALVTQYMTNWIKNDNKAVGKQIHPQFKNKILVNKAYIYFTTEIANEKSSFKSLYITSFKAGKKDKTLGQYYDYKYWFCYGDPNYYGYQEVVGRLSIGTYKNKPMITSDDILDFNGLDLVTAGLPESVTDQSIADLTKHFGEAYFTSIEETRKKELARLGIDIEPVENFDAFVEGRKITKASITLAPTSPLKIENDSILGQNIESGSFTIQPGKADQELLLEFANIGSGVSVTFEQEGNLTGFEVVDEWTSGIIVYPLEGNKLPIEVTVERLKANASKMTVVFTNAHTATAKSDNVVTYKIPVVIPYE